MWKLKKVYRFEASHQLPSHDGKCRNLHGHSWRLGVYVGGIALQESGPKVGMLIDYSTIDRVIQPLVDVYLDHKHLNESLKMENPTSENIAEWIYGRTREDFRYYMLAIEICETENTSCVYGEKM